MRIWLLAASVFFISCISDNDSKDSGSNDSYTDRFNPVYMDALHEEEIILPASAYNDSGNNWNYPRMSPSGQWIYFTNRKNNTRDTLYIMHRETGNVFTAFANSQPGILRLDWLGWLNNERINFGSSLQGLKDYALHLLDVTHITKQMSTAYSENIIDLEYPQSVRDNGGKPLLSPSGKWAHYNTRNRTEGPWKDSLFIINMESMEFSLAFIGAMDSSAFWNLSEFSPWIEDNKIIISRELVEQRRLEVFNLDVTHITGDNPSSVSLVPEASLTPVWLPQDSISSLFHLLTFSPTGKWMRFNNASGFHLLEVGTQQVHHVTEFSPDEYGPSWEHGWVDDTQIFFRRYWRDGDLFGESFHLLNVSFITGK